MSFGAMFTVKTCAAYYIFFNIFCNIYALVPLPIVEDCAILKAEKTVRNTVKSVFKALKVHGISKKPKIKQLSGIHNSLVTKTLKDCDNHIYIARISKVNIIDKNNRNFIEEINNILNASDNSKEETDNNTNVSTYVHKFINKLKKIQESHASHKDNVINTKILQLIELDKKANATKVSINASQKQEAEFDQILDDDDIWHQSGRRIYEGRRTSIKKFPFMASIHFFNKFQCAGSIIKNDLVITSASCLQIAWNNRFFRENPAFLSVRVGCAYYDHCGESIAVLEIYFHPQYDPDTLKHNIAIMRLNRKINFRRSKGKIKKIEVDQNAWSLPITCSVTVVGWGAKDYRNTVSNVYKNKLSYAKLDLYMLKDCQDHYSKDFVTYRHFCAGFVSKGSGACNRDAGGPGLYESTLMGVISFGSPVCGAPDSPTVFTKLGFYWDWIENIMDQDNPSYRIDTTTLPPLTLFTVPTQATTEILKIVPLWDVTTTSTTTTESSLLRIPQVENLYDAMSPGIEIKDWDDSESVSKEEGESNVNVSEEDKVTLGPLNVKQNNKEIQSTTDTVRYTILETEPTVETSTTEDDESDNNEIGLNIEYFNETTNFDDKLVEKDIMSFIDKLDMDEIIRSIIPEEAEINEDGLTKKEKIDLIRSGNLSFSTATTHSRFYDTQEPSLSIQVDPQKSSQNTKISIVAHKPPSLLFNPNVNKKRKQYLL